MHRRNFTVDGCGHEPANGVYVFEGFRNGFPFFVKRELQFEDEPINFGDDKLDVYEYTRPELSCLTRNTANCTPKPKNARIVEDESGVIFALYGGVDSREGLMWVIARVDCNPPIYYYAAIHKIEYGYISVYSCAVPTDTWTILNGAAPAPRLKLTIYATELLDKGSEVEVFSTSQQKWKRAVISQVDGDEFYIECEADGWRSRVRRGSGRLRPTVEQRKERERWKEGTPVEVFSVSNSKWKPAKIIEIKQLRVEYADGSGGKWMGADSDWIKAINQPEHESDLLNYEGQLASHMSYVVRGIFSTYACGRHMLRHEFCRFLQSAWPNKKRKWYVQVTNDEFDHFQNVMQSRELLGDQGEGPPPRRRRGHRHHVPMRLRGGDGNPRTPRRERRHRHHHHHHTGTHHHRRSRHHHSRSSRRRDVGIRGIPPGSPLTGHSPSDTPITPRVTRTTRSISYLPGYDGSAPVRRIPIPLYNDDGVVRFNPHFDFNQLTLYSNDTERQVIPLSEIRLTHESEDFVMEDLDRKDDEEDDEDEFAELEKNDEYEYTFSAFAEYFLNSCSDRPKATRTLLVNLAHREFERPAPPPRPWDVQMKVNAYSKTQKEWKRATIVQMNKQGGKLHVQYCDESGRKWLARYSDHIRPRIERRARIALWATSRFLEVLDGLQQSELGSLLSIELARFLVEYNFDECNQCHYFDDTYAVCFGQNCDAFMCRTCWNDGFNFHNCDALTQGHRRASESLSPDTPFLFVPTFDFCPEIHKKRKDMAQIRLEEARRKFAVHTTPTYSVNGLFSSYDRTGLETNEMIEPPIPQDFEWLNQQSFLDSDMDGRSVTTPTMPRLRHVPRPSRTHRFTSEESRSPTSPSPSLIEPTRMVLDIPSRPYLDHRSRGYDILPSDPSTGPPFLTTPFSNDFDVVRVSQRPGSTPNDSSPITIAPPFFEYGRETEVFGRRFYGTPYSMDVDEEDEDEKMDGGPAFVRQMTQEHDQPTRSQRLFGEETLLQRVGSDATGASQSSHSSTPDLNDEASSPVLDEDGDFEVLDSVDAAPSRDNVFDTRSFLNEPSETHSSHRTSFGNVSPFAH